MATDLENSNFRLSSNAYYGVIGSLISSFLLALGFSTGLTEMRVSVSELAGADKCFCFIYGGKVAETSSRLGGVIMGGLSSPVTGRSVLGATCAVTVFVAFLFATKDTLATF